MSRLTSNSGRLLSCLDERVGRPYLTPGFFGHLGRLELLQDEGREVYIPQAVVEEVIQKPDTAAQALHMACATWMQVRDVADRTRVNLVQAALHKGEAEAIVLATELQAERLVMDDQDARRFADRCSLQRLVLWAFC